MFRLANQRVKLKEEIAYICSMIKVNPALMNEQDRAVLDFHFQRILLEKGNNIKMRVKQYVGNNEVVLYKDFQDLRKLQELKDYQENLTKRAIKLEINNYLNDLLSLDMYSFCECSNLKRNRKIKEKGLDMYCANQIVEDYEYVHDLFINRKDLIGLYPTISTKVGSNHYLLDKALYKCEIKVEDDKLVVSNFIINERNKERIKELQR